MDDYGSRYCAFVDVLGFRSLIADLGKGSISVQEMRDLLTIVHDSSGADHKHWPTEFRAQSISDAVAISTAASRYGLVEILRAIEMLTTKLLERGYFVRGSLVKGPLYHDNKMIFGEALVNAYRLESEVVKYPRIMVTRDVWLDFERYSKEEGENGSLANWLKQSDDGPWFVHTLRTTEAVISKVLLDNIGRLPGYAEALRPYAAIQERLQTKFDEAIDDPRHFEKLQWFADYWNRTIPYGLFGKKIVGPGLNQAVWTAGLTTLPLEE
jgi:hypothetical protein